MKYDFGGWATRNDLTCADGRVIKKMHSKDRMDRLFRWYGCTTITIQIMCLDLHIWKTEMMAFTPIVNSTIQKLVRQLKNL